MATQLKMLNVRISSSFRLNLKSFIVLLADSISSLKCLSPSLGIFRVEIPYRGQAFSVQKRVWSILFCSSPNLVQQKSSYDKMLSYKKNHFSRVYCWQSALSCKVLVANHSDNVLTHEKCTENNQITRLGCAPA
jgi:hypothetical protein